MPFTAQNGVARIERGCSRDLFGLVLLIALAAGAVRAAEAEAPASKYMAFRASRSMTGTEWRKALADASRHGIRPLQSGALQRQGLAVFAVPQSRTLARKIDRIFASAIRVPVREYRGVLSVSSGYFYLQFQDQVPMEVVRERLGKAGFRIVTPDPLPRTVLVVEGSRLPEHRERELQKLKELAEILYAAPDDIPLPERPRDAK